MTVTSADVSGFIDQYVGSALVGQQEIDRIVRVLNEHRCGAGRTRSLLPTKANQRGRREDPARISVR